MKGTLNPAIDAKKSLRSNRDFLAIVSHFEAKYDDAVRRHLLSPESNDWHRGRAAALLEFLEFVRDNK